MVLVLKTSVGQLTASSNLALSAKKIAEQMLGNFLAPRPDSNSRALRSKAYREFGVASEAKESTKYFLSQANGGGFS